MKNYWNKLNPKTKRMVWLVFVILTVGCSNGPKIKSCEYSYHKVDYENRLTAEIYYSCKMRNNKPCQVTKNRNGEVIANNCN